MKSIKWGVYEVQDPRWWRCITCVAVCKTKAWAILLAKRYEETGTNLYFIKKLD